MEQINGLQKIIGLAIDFFVKYSFQIIGPFFVIGIGLYAANLAVYKRLSRAGITIPFPQRDVHVVSKAKAPKA